jgi:translation initiation factor 6
MNDKGCIISYLIKNLKEKIERFVGLDCQIASKKYMVIGSLAIATNKGCLVSPIFDEDEIKKIEKVLKVKVDVGTANFGSYYVGSCIIANSNFALISPKTTGVEIAKIEEVLLRGG